MKFKMVQIQTTSACNARCRICPQSTSWFAKNPGHMSDTLYTKILQDINEADPKFSARFCPYLMNEPFTDPKMLSRMREAWETLDAPRIEISTNAALLDLDMIDDLVDIYEEFDFQGSFIVSHFGVNKKTFEDMMGLDYDKCLMNLNELLWAFDGRVKFMINNVELSRDGQCVLYDHIEVANYFKLLSEQFNWPLENLKIPKKSFHSRAGNTQMEGWDYKKDARIIDMKHRFNCCRLDNMLHVLYTGEVTCCCMDYGHEEILGNLNTQTVQEVMTSGFYDYFRDKARGRLSSDPDFLCKRCQSPGG